jgi:hypothetical protein
MMVSPYRTRPSLTPCLNWNSGLAPCPPRPRRFADYGGTRGELYRDDLARVFVDVADEPEHRQFFLEFKERLKVRFGQIDIWMATYPIEVL